MAFAGSHGALIRDRSRIIIAKYGLSRASHDILLT